MLPHCTCAPSRATIPTATTSTSCLRFRALRLITSSSRTSSKPLTISRTSYTNFAARIGFSVYRHRSSNKVKGSGYPRIDFACSPNETTASTARSRASSTIRHDCGWEATAKVFVSSGRRWVFEIRPMHRAHNQEVGVIKQRFTEE